MFIDATICRTSVPQQPPRMDRCGSRVSSPWPDDFQRLRGQRSGPGVGSRAVIQHRASGGPATFPTVQSMATVGSANGSAEPGAGAGIRRGTSAIAERAVAKPSNTPWIALAFS